MILPRDIAARKGCSVRAVQNAAAALGVPKTGPIYAFTEEQAAAVEAAIRPRGWPKGRPRKVTG
jgi:hypothetical protein